MISFESFLWIGIMVDIFRKLGHVPVWNERLNIFVSGSAMAYLTDYNSWLGMLFGPTLLLGSIFDIMSIISCGVVGAIMNEF